MEPDNGFGSDRSPESFDEVADLYQTARPLYPVELIDDLVALTDLGPGSKLLEIGCGTGQITVPLAQRGLRVTALEPGKNLAAIARSRLSFSSDSTVVLDRFEDYDLPDEPFDLVLSATAFHWVDPDIRVVKAAQALRAGGCLAIVHTRWGVGSEMDAFTARSQRCYDRWHDDGRATPTIDQISAGRSDLDGSSEFTVTAYRQYQQRNHHTTDSFLDLLRTFSDVRSLDGHSRDGLLDCLGRLIDTEFGGELDRTDLREMWIARRRPPS